jgi:hypothetical protein
MEAWIVAALVAAGVTAPTSERIDGEGLASRVD